MQSEAEGDGRASTRSGSPGAGGHRPPAQTDRRRPADAWRRAMQGTSGGADRADQALHVSERDRRSDHADRSSNRGEDDVRQRAPAAGVGIGGAIDIAFVGRTSYVLGTLVSDDVGGDQIDGIYRVDDVDSFTVVADIGRYSRTTPRGPVRRSDRPAVRPEPVAGGGFLVSDGHHNRILRCRATARSPGCTGSTMTSRPGSPSPVTRSTWQKRDQSRTLPRRARSSHCAGTPLTRPRWRPASV